MAVKPELIRVAIRKLFPTANLSTKRIDEISARLARKPKDDATESEIDEVITEYNDNGAMTFQEIAQADDKIRQLESKTKTEVKEEVKKEEVIENDPMKLMLKAITDLTAKVGAFEQEKQKESITSKFANDERVKNIPAIIRKGFTPTSAEDYESNIEALVAEYTPYAEKLKLAGFTGEDNPASSTGGDEAKKGTVKAKSVEETKGLADSI